jgi:membrane-bound serine protease (ClpP class)
MQTLFIILVILLGFCLIMADLLFIPGGVVAALGGVFIIGAIVYAWKTLGKEFALLLVFGSAALTVILAFISVKFRVWKIFVVHENEGKEQGFASHKGKLETLIGKTGEVATDLRPAGTVQIEGKKYDGVTEGGFIEKGKRIEVIGVSTGQLKVRIDSPSSPKVT